jgi:hypothetical protein
MLANYILTHNLLLNQRSHSSHKDGSTRPHGDHHEEELSHGTEMSHDHTTTHHEPQDVEMDESGEHSHSSHKHETDAAKKHDMPAWKKKALEADPMAAPFGGSWTTEASVNAAENKNLMEQE